MDASKIIDDLLRCSTDHTCETCPFFADKAQTNAIVCRNLLMRRAAAALETTIGDNTRVRKENNRFREELAKRMSDTASSLRQQVEHLHQQVSTQTAAWNPGSEKPEKRNEYLVLVMYRDVYGVPVTGLPRYDLAVYRPSYGWCVPRSCIVLHWQELPPPPIDEED